LALLLRRSEIADLLDLRQAMAAQNRNGLRVSVTGGEAGWDRRAVRNEE
jgi:hypothetical protein